MILTFRALCYYCVWWLICVDVPSSDIIYIILNSLQVACAHAQNNREINLHTV